MIVCLCKSVSSRDIAAAIQGGAASLDHIAERTRAGSGCGGCREALQQSLDMAHGKLAKPVIRLAGWTAVDAG